MFVLIYEYDEGYITHSQFHGVGKTLEQVKEIFTSISPFAIDNVWKDMLPGTYPNLYDGAEPESGIRTTIKGDENKGIWYIWRFDA